MVWTSWQMLSSSDNIIIIVLKEEEETVTKGCTLTCCSPVEEELLGMALESDKVRSADEGDGEISSSMYRSGSPSSSKSAMEDSFCSSLVHLHNNSAYT